MDPPIPSSPNAEPAPMLPGAAKRAPLERSKPTAPAMATAAPVFRQNGCGAAEKLEPGKPWAAIMRELGVPEAAALKAHENCKMPPNINPA